MSKKYLAIKNWSKHQLLKGGNRPQPYIQDWTDKDNHPAYNKLRFSQRYILDACQRLRGRFGCNLPNDPAWIQRALGSSRKDAVIIPSTVRLLTEMGFLVETDQQHSSTGEPLQEKTRGDNTRQQQPAAAPAEIPSEIVAEKKPEPTDDCKCPMRKRGHHDPECKHRMRIPPETAKSPAKKRTDIRDWDEPVGEYSAVQIRRAIRYQLDVLKSEWYQKNLTAGFVRRKVQKLIEDTPDKFLDSDDPKIEQEATATGVKQAPAIYGGPAKIRLENFEEL